MQEALDRYSSLMRAKNYKFIVNLPANTSKMRPNHLKWSKVDNQTLSKLFEHGSIDIGELRRVLKQECQIEDF